MQYFGFQFALEALLFSHLFSSRWNRVLRSDPYLGVEFFARVIRCCVKPVCFFSSAAIQYQ